MPLTPDMIQKLNVYGKEVADQSSKCNITGTLFTYGELIKLGHELLVGNRSADDFAKVNHVNQQALDGIVTDFQLKCGCKRIR